jgi:PAS domain S-box-containing protein
MSQHAAPDVPLAAEMSAIVRAKDWSKTRLGASDNWPPSLTLAVNIILASGFPMCVRWGPEFVMIYNDGYRPILRDRHPHAIGLPFDEVWPEVQSQLRPLHQAILAGTSGAFFAEDLLINVKRHSPEWEEARFTVSYSPIPDSSSPSGVGGVLVTAVETTNRVRTEEALRASEERFAGILQQTAVGVIQCDLEGHFLLVNERFCEITGRMADELLGLCVSDITYPKDRATDAKLRGRLVADGVPFIVEKRHVRPDGSYVWTSVNVSLMRSADGKPQHFIGVVQDITGRKAAEGVLREKEADLRLVLDSATDAIYCVDTDAVTTMCNAAFLRMLGFECEEQAIGQKLHHVIHHSRPDGSHYPEEACPIYRTAKSGDPAHVDNELFYRFDGSSFPVEYWVSPILRDGELQGAVCTFIDITERRWAQEQQNLLVRELNHRIKNLFAVTSGMIALSARSAATPKQYAANIQGRLDALAIAHNLILPNPAGQAAAVASVTHLDALLQHILAPYVAARDPGTSARLIVDGPVVALGPRAVTTLALVLHELATNAAKYGALSVEDGSIRTVWSCVDDVLAMKWVETGGRRSADRLQQRDLEP